MNLGRGQQISLQQVENAIYQLREVPDYLKGSHSKRRAAWQSITHTNGGRAPQGNTTGDGSVRIPCFDYPTGQVYLVEREN